MGRKFSKFILRLFGWHTNGALPEGITRAVIVSAPHTSYWDFVIGRFTFWAIDVNIRFLIKKEAFRFPMGFLLRKLGGIPVERDTANSMVDQVIRMFRENEALVIVITPEGTREKVLRWKKGFYIIAQRAGVPIALSFINYGNKTGGMGPVIIPSGDYEKDLETIQDFYRDKIACHPERFNLSAENTKDNQE
jgi:1-acyl-sn-glycerol-3-phosphate acyltransferase